MPFICLYVSYMKLMKGFQLNVVLDVYIKNFRVSFILIRSCEMRELQIELYLFYEHHF
jgi:hypothetical protein